MTSANSSELGLFKPLREGTQDFLRLQDFCFFEHDGYTYVAPMMKDFAHEGIPVARSKDYKNWEMLGKAISKRLPEDESMVWAPHVVEDDGTFYMFYTGVSQPAPQMWCQKIMVATTKDPSKPESWNQDKNFKFIVDGKEQFWFKPSHKGNVWDGSTWADCRDPMALKHNGVWHLFYSGNDVDGSICGVATATDIRGPWTDQGAVMKLDSGIPESCFVIPAPDGSWVMMFNHAGGVGIIKSAWGKSLVPVDGKPTFNLVRPLTETSGETLTGWAHEFWPGKSKDHFICGALSGYFVDFKDSYLVKEKEGWQFSAAPEKKK